MRGDLEMFHIPANQIDCMLEAMDADGRFHVVPTSNAAPAAAATVDVAAQELDEYALGCGVDFGDLWYQWD